jgi:hypothetical protein
MQDLIQTSDNLFGSILVCNFPAQTSIACAIHLAPGRRQRGDNFIRTKFCVRAIGHRG